MSDNYAEIWNKLHKSFITNAKAQYDAWLDGANGYRKYNDRISFDILL